MPSNKSRTIPSRVPVEPQRRHGKERVAKLLEVGAAVFAEKGYEAATMAEIAERAGAPIGSLYRFFPNKEVLAEALITRCVGQIDVLFAEINRQAEPAAPEKTADTLLRFLVDVQKETAVIAALLDMHSDRAAKRSQFRQIVLQHIVGTLHVLAPSLPSPLAEDIAIVLLNNMKMMKGMAGLRPKENVPTSPGAMEELRHMNRLYLADRLAAFLPPSGR